MLKKTAYLQTGSVGPVPASVLAAYVQRLSTHYEAGPGTLAALELWRELEEVRARVARWFGAGPGEIAFLENTTAGVNLGLLGIDWQPGDEVITSDMEHPAVAVPLAHLQQEHGVRVIAVPSTDARISAEQVMEAITPRTRAICLSHVSYSTGAILPVAEICRFARERRILTVIDGAQSAGMLPVSLHELGCDVYAFAGYKWLLGLEGTAICYVRRGVMVTDEDGRLGRDGTADSSREGGLRSALTKGVFLKSRRVGFRSVTDPYSGAGLQLREDARRFETGTSSALSFWTLGESLRFLESLGGITAIWGRIRKLASSLVLELNDIPGIRVVSSPGERSESGADCSDVSGLVTFMFERHHGAQPKEVADELSQMARDLLDKYHIAVRSIPRPAGLRASVHFFNNERDLERLVGRVKALARK